MEGKEKLINKYRLGLAIQAIINENKSGMKENAIMSLRKLAAASGVEYSIIQKISSGQKDPQFTTILSLADGLNISIIELLSYFEKITEQVAIKKMNESLKKSKRRKTK